MAEAAAQIAVTLKRSEHITENKQIEHNKRHLTTTDCIYAQSILHQSLIVHKLILLTPKAQLQYGRPAVTQLTPKAVQTHTVNSCMTADHEYRFDASIS